MKKPARTNLDWRERLSFAAVASFTIAYGYGKFLAGKPVYENWRGLDITAYFVIFFGVLLLLVAVFPWGRIHFLWDTGRKKHR
jgi:hypothetical protein